MTSAVDRRGVILGAAGLALASRARAKSPPRLGVLRAYPPDDSYYPAFANALRALGHVDGTTIEILYRQVADAEALEVARALVASGVDILFAPNPHQAQAARQATRTIPIVVAAVGDAIGTGLAASLAQPGGNVTGLTALGSNLSGKRLGLIRDLLPDATRIAVLWNPGVPDKQVEWREIAPVAERLALDLVSVEVRTGADFDGALERIAAAGVQAVLALGEPLVSLHRGRVIRFAAAARLPTMFNWREAVQEGALISYGPDIADLYRRAAGYVDRILRGARPAVMPIEEPTRFDLSVNLGTARTFGITVPPSILALAESVLD